MARPVMRPSFQSASMSIRPPGSWRAAARDRFWRRARAAATAADPLPQLFSRYRVPVDETYTMGSTFRFSAPGNFPLERIEQLLLVHFLHVQGEIDIMGDTGQDHFLALHTFPFIRKIDFLHPQRGRQLDTGFENAFPDFFCLYGKRSGAAAAGDLESPFFFP